MYYPDTPCLYSYKQAKIAVLRLQKQLCDKSPAKRENAVLELIGIGRKHARLANVCLVACRSAACDSNESVRDVAADGIGDLGGRTDYRLLCSLLKDESFLGRTSAAKSFFVVGPALAIPKLQAALLSDPDELVQKFAVFGLMSLERPDLVLPVLQNALSEQISYVGREEVLSSLIELCGEEYLATWLELLMCPDWLPGDRIVDRLHNTSDQFVTISQTGRAQICEALEARIEKLKTYELSPEGLVRRTERVSSALDQYRGLLANPLA